MDQMEDVLKNKQTKSKQKKKSESLCSGNLANMCAPVMVLLFLSLHPQSLCSCESALACHTHGKVSGRNCSGEKENLIKVTHLHIMESQRGLGWKGP